jgi:hypothetical protein
MNIKVIAALLVLTSASLALPQDSMAGQPGGRTPKDKTCPFEAVSRCEVSLGDAFDVVNFLINHNEDGNFLSRNPDKDAGTLKCKISGADIKLYQGKTDEASYLMYVALEKIWSLYGQGKLGGDALAEMNTAFTAAKECIDF